MTAIPTPGPFTSLRRFVRPPSREERCELCGKGIPPDHPHLLEVIRRQVVCSCAACALLFSSTGTGRYRRIPRRITLLNDFRLVEASWSPLDLPIRLAFFVRQNATNQVVVYYPGPAGLTEMDLPPHTWSDLVAINPLLAELEPDVEALLVHRLGHHRDHFRAPIDRCFALTGLIRTHWQGLSGGSVWAEVDRFFAELKRNAESDVAMVHAREDR